MIDPESMAALRRELRERMVADRGLLDTLREELRAGLGEMRRIMPRQTTAISLVGTDGGNNRVEFDPFMAQLIRVVDSSNNEYCLEVITPTSDLAALSERHMSMTEAPSALGRMMKYLGVETVWDLSPMIKRPPAVSSPSWVQVYRELTEWAVLFSLVREKDYGTDTVIVWDGLLRPEPPAISDDEDAPNLAETPPDALRSDTESAVAVVEQDADVRKKILQGSGIPWGVMMGKIEAALPASLRQDKNRINRLVVEVVTKIVGGPQDKAWATEQRTAQSGKSVRFIVRR